MRIQISPPRETIFFSPPPPRPFALCPASWIPGRLNVILSDRMPFTGGLGSRLLFSEENRQVLSLENVERELEETWPVDVALLMKDGWS